MKKKILFLSRSLGAGGAEKRMINIACLLKQRGYYVSFVSYSRNDFFADVLKEENIEVKWLQEGSFARKLINVWRIIKREKYEVTISLLPTLNIINCFSSIGNKNKVVIGESSASSQFEKFMGWKYVVRGYFEDYMAFLLADRIVSNSKNACELRKKRSGFLSKKLVVIYNPVTVTPSPCDYIVKNNGILHIVVGASIQSVKNPLIVIKAISQLDSLLLNKLRLDWYGSPVEKTLHETIKNEIRNNKLEDFVCFHDATKDIATKMIQADVVALFSVVEGLPNAICEGMMLGKPILMTKVSDYSTLVNNNGFLCESNDEFSIKKAITEAINTSPEVLVKMGSKSLEKAEKLFKPEAIGDEWRDTIDRV